MAADHGTAAQSSHGSRAHRVISLYVCSCYSLCLSTHRVQCLETAGKVGAVGTQFTETDALRKMVVFH